VSELNYRLIAGKRPLLKTVSIAIQFDLAPIYFDRSGRLTNEILASDQDWIISGIDAKRTILLHPEREYVFEFSARHAALVLTRDSQPDDITTEKRSEFLALIGHLFPLLVHGLEVSDLRSVNYKEHYHFPTEAIDESEKWLFDLRLATHDDSLHSNFGMPYAATTVLVFASDDCRYRIEMKGLERHAHVAIGNTEFGFQASEANRHQDKRLLKALNQKRNRNLDPAYFASVELEAFLWKDIDIEFEVKDFATRAAGHLLDKFRDCVSKATSGRQK
jgi:hypothetical protein